MKIRSMQHSHDPRLREISGRAMVWTRWLIRPTKEKYKGNTNYLRIIKIISYGVVNEAQMTTNMFTSRVSKITMDPVQQK